jgi:hypothetical protein
MDGPKNEARLAAAKKLKGQAKVAALAGAIRAVQFMERYEADRKGKPARVKALQQQLHALETGVTPKVGAWDRRWLGGVCSCVAVLVSGGRPAAACLGSIGARAVGGLWHSSGHSGHRYMAQAVQQARRRSSSKHWQDPASLQEAPAQASARMLQHCPQQYTAVLSPCSQHSVLTSMCPRCPAGQRGARPGAVRAALPGAGLAGRGA